ncbi:hypothetical protein Pcinc_016282 [Petrolisthes cinctipes]|uniref:Uncharacterized protein n=1 Tax=Petrolisthes cinctipes TaxID=88211 RepID=A0AAE1FWK4_PETCI|nr:hypothetical protein Pcinc_016282 [Petrolisthes cinctipes]
MRLCFSLSTVQVISDDYGATSQCNFYIAREAIWVIPMAFVFPKKSRLIPEINKWVGILKESGLLSYYVGQFTSNATHCLVPPGKENGVTTLVLSLTDFAGIFTVLGVGLVLSLVVFLLEKTVHSLNHKTNY